MKTFEVWEYGFGKYHRFRFKEISAEKAVSHFLNRNVFGERSFRDTLLEKKKKDIKICVKDPLIKGTRKNPNYPKIFHLKVDFVVE